MIQKKKKTGRRQPMAQGGRRGGGGGGGLGKCIDLKTIEEKNEEKGRNVRKRAKN